MKTKTKNRQLLSVLTCALCVLAILMMSWEFAAQRASLCDYVSINGDFQSYNVFRRILAGQTPYVDFTNYIGMAPIWVNLPLIAMNNSFHTSLFVTTFTSNVLFCIGVFLIFRLACRSLPVSCLAAALISKIVSTGILHLPLGPKYGYLATSRVEGLYSPSNSMRGARSFLPFLLVLLMMLTAVLIHRFRGQSTDWITALSRPGWCAAAAFVTGFFVTWSNDYGPAAFGALIVLVIVLQAARHHLRFSAFLRNLALLFLCGAGGMLLSITLVSGGHPGRWFSDTLQSAEYQFFYFNGTGGKNVLTYLFTTPSFWLYAGILILFLFRALYLLVQDRADNGLFYLVYIILTILAATLIYILGGSGFSCREPIQVLTVLLCIALGLRLILEHISFLSRLIPAGTVCLLGLLTSYYTFLAVTFTAPEQGTLIPALGGRSTLTRELVDAAALVDDQTVFSTYATGLEVVTGQFQPSRSDYIIHALGQKGQKAYAETFLACDPPFAHTSTLPVEEWVANQNWYFYRELLPRYRQVMRTEYAFLWEKCPDQELEAQVRWRIEPISSSSVKIICESDDLSSFAADLRIRYSTRFADPWSRLLSLGRSAVLATTTCIKGGDPVAIALPAASEEAFLPVQMSGGVGSVTLQSAYGSGIDLSLTDVEFIRAVPLLDLQWQEN